MRGLTCFFLLLAVISLQGSAACRESQGALSVRAWMDRDVYRASENVSVSVEVKNLSGKALLLVRPQEGSERRIRYPYCLFEVRNARGKEVAMKYPIDKTVAPLEPGAFFEVKPGEVTRLYATPYSLSEHMKLEPGAYSLVFRYSTASPKESRWYGLYSDDYWDGERKGNEFWKKREAQMTKNRELLSRVPSLTILSEEVRFTVTGTAGITQEKALAIAEEVCLKKGWKWVKPHARDNNLWWDVTTGFGSLGNNAFIRIEKSTGRVMDHHMTGP